MAVPSTGQLSLRGDIALEVDGNATGVNVSLRALSASAGFTSPDSMSEFYGYSSALAPSVTSNAITDVGTTTLRANGNVTSDGGATITERGFYIGTNSVAPTSNVKYIVSGTTGSYLRDVTGLSDNTTYYCWAYATNSVGTTYGARVQTTTVQAFNPTYAAYDTSTSQVNQNYHAPSATLFNGSLNYFNPLTSSLVNYGYMQDFPSEQTKNFTFFATKTGNWNQFCTNAENRTYWTVPDMQASQAGANRGIISHYLKRSGAATFSNWVTTGSSVGIAQGQPIRYNSSSSTSIGGDTYYSSFTDISAGAELQSQYIFNYS
jgi:hypothetical protein